MAATVVGAGEEAAAFIGAGLPGRGAGGGGSQGGSRAGAGAREEEAGQLRSRLAGSQEKASRRRRGAERGSWGEGAEVARR